MAGLELDAGGSLSAATNINDLGPQCLQHILRQGSWVLGSAVTLIWTVSATFC
jgi:hypothetical protein